jgi:hypothetical protein
MHYTVMQIARPIKWDHIILVNSKVELPAKTFARSGCVAIEVIAGCDEGVATLAGWMVAGVGLEPTT